MMDVDWRELPQTQTQLFLGKASLTQDHQCQNLCFSSSGGNKGHRVGVAATP